MANLEDAICQKQTWLDQQGFPLPAIDKIVDAMRTLLELDSEGTALFLIVVSLVLQIRSQNVAAARVYEAFRIVTKEIDDDDSGRSDGELVG